MTLSPQWSNAVVVRSDDGKVLQTQQRRTAERTSSSLTSSAGPRPIIVRPRDPHLFTAVSSYNNNTNNNSNNNNNNNNSGDTTMGVSGGSYNSDSSRGGTPFLASLLVGRDVVDTFWIPDPKRNEMGLLESMYRRTAANRTYVLLQSRPLPELQFNFSTCTGDNIDLSHEAFRLSKTSMALLQMERHLSDGAEVLLRVDAADSHGASGSYDHSSNSNNNNNNNNSVSGNQTRPLQGGISGRVFKDQLRNGLRTLHEEEYYLVRYRDYSTWAVQHYSEFAKKDHFWGKKYVEQCFAVHVGKEPGELIPITEAQFLFGVEILQRQLLEHVGLSSVPNINYAALSKDQFRSLGVILADGMRAVGVEGEEHRRRREEEEEAERKRYANANTYIPPSMWDWTPGAIKKRINHQLQSHYQALGRFVVRSAVLAVGLYIVWSYVRRVIPQDSTTTVDHRRGGQRSRRNNTYYEDSTDTFTPSGFFRSVLLGPKEVFDYLLAPAK